MHKDSMPITRRRALAAGAAGAAAAIVGTRDTAAAEHDRAKWLALYQLYVDLDDAHTAALVTVDEAQVTVRRTLPPRPSLQDRTQDTDEQLAGLEQWKARERELEACAGVPALKAAADAAGTAVMDLEREIAKLPAASIIGIAVKLAIARRVDIFEDLDLDNIGSAAVVDVMRLADLPEAFGERGNVS